MTAGSEGVREETPGNNKERELGLREFPLCFSLPPLVVSLLPLVPHSHIPAFG